ncbi:MAG: glycoside hydrolase family 3 N-terminal domain-containing protein [Archangium sp.]|nr:glycoside hydrolase family 3 N-terminal domain-containing protein [Archangium sp.]MDP3570092.1 glycoside hydrolase family 3 N-terminal domain-containing protein [Archangium sp.]
MLPLVVAVLLTADAGTSLPFVGDIVDAGIPPQRLNTQPLSRKVNEERVERVLTSLSVRERAGQLILAYPQIDRVGPVEVGGLLFVGNALKNIPRAKEKIDAARVRAKIPLFVSVDMEGGPSNRMKSVKALRNMPSARELALMDDAEVKRWGRRVGEAMKAVGLNLNLAPVLDVAPSGHMERNGRSFSGDPEIVVQKAMAYSRGLLEAGVVPIGKHFPGYGDTDGDSDHALVTSDWPQERVFAEAGVFVRAKEALGGVMLANVVYAAVDDKPAILSRKLVARVHEQDWLAITDDISIALLADAIGGTSEDVLKQSFLAGNDLLLTTAPPDWNKGIDYIGILTELAEKEPPAKKQLDESCRRVLRLKERMGLLDGL